MAHDREDIRLLILIILYRKPGYTANQECILKDLRDSGHALNRDLLHIELAWLNSADMVVDRATGGVHIATLTAEGGEVVEGVRDVPGIRRPRPGEVG